MRNVMPAVPRPALAVLAIAVVALVGCGTGTAASGGGSSSSAATSAALTATVPSTAQAATGSAGEVAEDLTFSGPLSGHMARGQRGDMYVCTGGNFVNNPNTKGQLVAGPIVGDVGGKQVRISITKIDYHGPGSYDAGGVAFDVGSDHYYPAKAPSGTLTVSAGGRGGTVNMDLAANSDPATVVGHAQGSWQCPADAY